MALNPQDYYDAAGGPPDMGAPDDAAARLAAALAQSQGGTATLTSGVTGAPMAGLSGPLSDQSAAFDLMAKQVGDQGGAVVGTPGQPMLDQALASPRPAAAGASPEEMATRAANLEAFKRGEDPGPAPGNPNLQEAVGGSGSAGTGAPVVALPPQPKPPGYDSGGDKEIKDAFDQQMKVAAAQTELEKQKANLQADAADHKLALDEQRQAAVVGLQLAAKQQRDADMANVQKAMANYQKLSAVVDPSRWWGSRDTGQKIAASIGVALGGIGSAFTGGPNQALEIVKDAISRDVDAQKESIQAGLTKGKEAISSRLTAMSMNRQFFKDDADALDATYAQMYGTAADKADALAKRLTGNQQAQVTGQQVAAQLRAEQGKSLQNISDRANARAQQKFANDLSLHASQRSDAEFALSLANKGGAPDQYVPGLGYALDKDAAKTLRDKKTSYENLDGLIDQAVSLRKKYGSEDIGPAKAQMKSISAQLKKAIISDDGLSTRIGDSELKFLDQMSGGDITDWGYVLPQLEALKKNVNTAFIHVARNHLIPGTRPVESEGGGSYRARKPGE